MRCRCAWNPIKSREILFPLTHSVGRASVPVPYWEHVDARGALSLLLWFLERMKGKVGVVERPTVVMCRGLGGKGHVPLSSRPEPTIIQAKLSPVLNGCSERAEVRTGPTKKQTLENVAFKIYHSGFRARINKELPCAADLNVK